MRDNIYKLALPFLFLIPLYASADHCNVAQIRIIAGTWENTNTKTSLALQAQDSSGASCHVAETLRFSLQSSNAQGIFTGQTGNTLTYSISSGTANKNFYYENGETSVYTLTAKAGYGPAGGWTESFSTTYTSTSTNTPTTTSSEMSSSSSGGSSGSISNSVHYSSSALGSRKSEPSFVLDAGRSRMGSVGSPMEFRAETGFDYTRNGRFTWNFGDGTERDGEILSHTYEFPGDYAVVLNAVFPEGHGVSRINVKVIDPQISLVLASPEKIEIKNSSKQETSLYGRALLVKDRTFLFPKDTIIMSGQNIAFSSRVTGLAPNNLFEVQLLIVGDTENSKIREKIEQAKIDRIKYLSTEIAVLQSKVAAAQIQVKDDERVDLAEAKDKSEEVLVQPASVNSSVPTPISTGWLATLKRFLMRRE